VNLVDVVLPNLPDCWESCGACASGEVCVAEVLVEAGERIARDSPVLVLETDKTTIDIPAEQGGVVAEVCVVPGDLLKAGTLLLRLVTD